MRRVLAACCFVWFATKLIAVYLPPAALGLLAAVFVCVFWYSLALARRDYSRLLPLVGLAAILVHTLVYSTVVAPVFALAGEEIDALVVAEQVDPGFQDGTVRGEFTVMELNGRKLPVWKRFRISSVAMPECERADRLRGHFSVELLERDEYYYGNLADGVLLQVEGAEKLSLEGQSHAPRFFLRGLQETLARSCRRYLPQELGGVLSAMAVGDKSRLTDEVTEAYRAAGVSHLLVVSGLHLTLLCGAFLGNRPCGGRFRKQKALAAMLLVLCMMALVGFTPSVTRAGVGALIFYTGAFFLQPADSFTSLGIAAVLLSLQNCYAVCDLGLQLSFAATVGVLCAARVFPPARMDEQEEHPWRFRLRRVCTSLLVPLFAAIFTLPLQLLHGLSASGVSVLTNLLVMSLVGPIVCLGLICAVTGLIPALYGVTRAVMLLAGVLVKLQNAIVFYMASLPAAKLVLPKAFTVFAVLVCGAALWYAWRLHRLRWAVPVLCAGLVLSSNLYGALTQDVVTIRLLGSTSSPCAVIVSEQQAMVLFRGGESNRQQVQDWLDVQGIGTAELWVDLRQNPGELNVQGRLIYTEDLPEGQQWIEEFHGIRLSLLNQSGANLALLEISGYRVAMITGRLEAGTPLQVDLLLAGASNPGMVDPVQVLTAKSYDWHTEQPDVHWKYAPLGGTVFIRPGRAITFEGVTNAA